MSKKAKAAAKLRQVRMSERLAISKKSLQPPAEIYLCVLGNGAIGSPRSLYVFTDHFRYLFNCGEGTQRLAHEYKMRLSKLHHIFFTHKSWKNLGGLLGLSLTIQDIGVPQITLHGPPDIENMYKNSKSFVILKNLTVDKQSPTDDPFIDECMEIHYVPIYSILSTSHHLKNNSSEEILEHCDKKQKLDDHTVLDLTVAYICKGHNKPGHLDLKKCLEKGVPPGPLLGELKGGHNVTLSSGETVYSRDVISEEEKCPVFIVLECPSEDFLEPLLNEEKFKSYQTNDVENSAALIVHFSPSDIVVHPKYQKWIGMFPETTVHLFLNEKCDSTSSIAIHRIQHMLHLIHPGIFGLLCETVASDSIFQNKPNHFLAKTMDKYSLRPHKGLDSSDVIIKPEDFIEEAESMSGFTESMEELQKILQENNMQNGEGSLHPEIIFLGTGSSIPSKVRNVSSIVVNVSPDCTVILDCGEGSYNQLVRIYGYEMTSSLLIRTSCIFISHLHADHHLGLFTLLRERKAAFDAIKCPYLPVIIVAPHFLQGWLYKCDKELESFSSLYSFVDNSHLQFDEICLNAFEEKSLEELHKTVEITTVPVKHCPNAYGVVLQNGDWKIVYSGDTVPCQKLVDAGSGCSLLIHEATMEDDLHNEAKKKMHSTTSQAIEIAEKMAAKCTILTHFSQRYAKVPLIDEKCHNHVGFAFDNMKVSLTEVSLLPLFIPPLQKLFAEHVEKLQERGIKRKEKKRNNSTEEPPTSSP